MIKLPMVVSSLLNPSCPNPRRKEKIKLKSFYFHTSLWCLKRFYEGLKGAFLGLRQFLATESPLKMMKNAFYFTSKALFILKIFKSRLD